MASKKVCIWKPFSVSGESILWAEAVLRGDTIAAGFSAADIIFVDATQLYGLAMVKEVRGRCPNVFLVALTKDCLEAQKYKAAGANMVASMPVKVAGFRALVADVHANLPV